MKSVRMLWLLWVPLWLAVCTIVLIWLIEDGDPISATSFILAFCGLFFMFGIVLPIAAIPKLMPSKWEKIETGNGSLIVTNKVYDRIVLLAFLLLYLAGLLIPFSANLQIGRRSLSGMVLSMGAFVLLILFCVFLARNRAFEARFEFFPGSIVFNYGNREVYNYKLTFGYLQLEDCGTRFLASFDDYKTERRMCSFITGKIKVKSVDNGKVGIPIAGKRHGEWKMPFSNAIQEEIVSFYS
ncbi:hypothetical protein PQG76_07140 [Corynebacterium falsenii]|uniref:hypothetical protein n=1 Tax=Corynebacterium falsenii TaxID=108486 RepID=UPI00234C08F3|nr:hypothetical protein [Corynebacterium falsenii]MDC7104277.1 hypothetical protein [Corynebacterium falsenii]